MNQLHSLTSIGGFGDARSIRLLPLANFSEDCSPGFTIRSSWRRWPSKMYNEVETGADETLRIGIEQCVRDVQSVGDSLNLRLSL